MKATTLAAITLVLTLSAPLAAQSLRPGIRLTLTRVEAMGGFTASGFLVVPASRVVRTPAPECGEGAVRIEAAGRDARGRIRGARLVVVATPTLRDVAIDGSACGATLSVELDDGSTISPDHGVVHAQLGAAGIDATIEGSATGPGGVPTTVAGRVVLPSS